METIIIIWIAFVAILYGYRGLEKRRHNRIVKSKIAFDRIARLSDVGEKDISYRIENVARIIGPRGPTDSIKVKFYYDNPKITNGNPSTYIGNTHEIYGNESNYSGLEETIADGIKFIKQMGNSNV